MTRPAYLSARACMPFVATALFLGCSSSSSGTGTTNGGSAGQAGTATQGGSNAQGGSTAQGGSSAPQGGTTAQAGTTAQGGGGAGNVSGSGGQAGSAGAAGGDPCQTALLCDDFEAYAAGSPPGMPWSNNMNGGTVAIDTTRFHSGSHSVKITAASAPGYRSAMIALNAPPFLPTANDVFYGRMMFWLDSAPQTNVHWTFIDAQGQVPGQAYHAIYRYGGQSPITDKNNMFLGSQMMANYETPDGNGPKSDCYLGSDKQLVPVATWSCAEWKFDGGANKMQFWLNGAEVTSLAINNTGQGCVNQPTGYAWTAPTFKRIDLGWESYQADDARTIWIDDVAISTTKIGCPQ